MPSGRVLICMYCMWYKRNVWGIHYRDLDDSRVSGIRVCQQCLYDSYNITCARGWPISNIKITDGESPTFKPNCLRIWKTSTSSLDTNRSYQFCYFTWNGFSPPSPLPNLRVQLQPRHLPRLVPTWLKTFVTVCPKSFVDGSTKSNGYFQPRKSAISNSPVKFFPVMFGT